MCVNPTEEKKRLNCLSIISAFLGDTRDQLELSQIPASCCPGAITGYVCAGGAQHPWTSPGSLLCSPLLPHSHRHPLWGTLGLCLLYEEIISTSQHHLL